MDHQLTNSYNRIILKPLTKQEIELMRLLRNRNRQWFTYSAEITYEDQLKWYQNYLTKTNDYMFSVYHSSSSSWIGAVALYDIDAINSLGEFGRILVDNEKVHEKGLGLDTTICACQIGFEQLGLSKIRLEVYSDNIAAKKTYERAGFSIKGCIADEKGREMFLMEISNTVKIY